MTSVKNAGVTMMVLNRNYTLASVHGHAVRFEKGKPAPVPNTIVREAVAIGAERADGLDAIVEEKTEKVATPVNPEDRLDAIIEAVKKTEEENEREDFTASGNPKVAAIIKRTGFRIDKTELNRALQRLAEDRALEARDGSN